MTGAALFTALVREPERIVDAGDEGLATLAPRLLGVVGLGAAAFGFSVGVHHSLVQGLYAAVKMPAVFLLPPVLAVPALAAVAEALGLALPARRAAAAGLCAMARIVVFLLAFAPLTWLAAQAVDSYRFTALSTTFVLALAGLAGLRVLARSPLGLSRASWSTRLLVLAASAALFGAVTAQTGWLLRPFILRPRLVPELLQPPESDVFTEIGKRMEGP